MSSVSIRIFFSPTLRGGPRHLCVYDMWVSVRSVFWWKTDVASSATVKSILLLLLLALEYFPGGVLLSLPGPVGFIYVDNYWYFAIKLWTRMYVSREFDWLNNWYGDTHLSKLRNTPVLFAFNLNSGGYRHNLRCVYVRVYDRKYFFNTEHNCQVVW